MTLQQQKPKLTRVSQEDTENQSRFHNKRQRQGGMAQENRKSLQPAHLDAHIHAQEPSSLEQKHHSSPKKAKRQTSNVHDHIEVTLERAINTYLADHEGGNHSEKTLEWHRTALGLLHMYLEQERGITLVSNVEAVDISGWFSSMRKTPGSRGKVRSERTIQTYARSARAFFNWLVLRGLVAK